MLNRISWFVKISNTSDLSCFGIGEAAPLSELSTNSLSDFEATLPLIIDGFNKKKVDSNVLYNAKIESIQHLLQENIPQIKMYSSLLFAFEVALLDLANGGQRIIFKNRFITGNPIPINGLIWMDEAEVMIRGIESKIREGFKCIKIKVGALDFEKECRLLQYVRQQYNYLNITLRLDANGAFGRDDVYHKLKILASFGIHSIEQPLAPGSSEMMNVCAHPAIAVALDEELIGVREFQEKEQLLRRLKPQFIVLKPTLHGGLYGCQQWICIAESLSISWWITSALESNIGLNAIAQFVSNFQYSLTQGLGTGNIYKDNFTSPLYVKDGMLLYEQTARWEI